MTNAEIEAKAVSLFERMTGALNAEFGEVRGYELRDPLGWCIRPLFGLSPAEKLAIVCQLTAFVVEANACDAEAEGRN